MADVLAYFTVKLLGVMQLGGCLAQAINTQRPQLLVLNPDAPEAQQRRVVVVARDVTPNVEPSRVCGNFRPKSVDAATCWSCEQPRWIHA